MRNIRVLTHAGKYSHSVNKKTKKSLLKNCKAIELEDGSLQLPPPSITVIDGKLMYHDGSKWRVLPQMWDTFINKGKDGQNIARYPIPFVFEGRGISRTQYEFSQ